MYSALDRNKKTQTKTQIVLTLSHAAPQSLGQNWHKIMESDCIVTLIGFFF